jgi:hypothetical protein
LNLEWLHFIAMILLVAIVSLISITELMSIYFNHFTDLNCYFVVHVIIKNIIKTIMYSPFHFLINHVTFHLDFILSKAN